MFYLQPHEPQRVISDQRVFLIPIKINTNIQIMMMMMILMLMMIVGVERPLSNFSAILGQTRFGTFAKG